MKHAAYGAGLGLTVGLAAGAYGIAKAMTSYLYALSEGKTTSPVITHIEMRPRKSKGKVPA